MKAEIKAELDAAKKELRADIPSHPMRDKCFAAMQKAVNHIDAALSLLANLAEKSNDA